MKIEVLSLVISAIAFLVSVAALYFQFFHTRDSVFCTVTGVRADQNDVTVQIAISNAGTRAVLLKDASLRLIFPSTSGGNLFFDDGNCSNYIQPILIAKDTIVTVRLSLPMSGDQLLSIASWLDEGRVVNIDGFWPYYARLSFVTVSGKVMISEERVIEIMRKEGGVRYKSRQNETWHVGGVEFPDIQVV
jgi:hypothetical protein